MRIAALLFTVALTLTAGFGSVQAQAPSGTISVRILWNGVVDRDGHYGILLFAANNIEEPLSPLRHLQNLISVRGEFTITDLHDGEYLVILASTHKQPANPEETVEFGNADPQVPGTTKRPAVRVTIENGQADKEAVFELESDFSDFPSTGVAAATASRLPPHLAPAVAGLGVLLFAAGGFAVRLQAKRGR